MRYRIAVGPIAERRTMTLHTAGAVAGDSAPAKLITAARDGFSLNAAVVCEDHQREKLERLCRYVSRAPLALERLSIDGDGLVVYELKHPFSDGTTHMLFEPLDFIARLAALDCRARIVPTILLHSRHCTRQGLLLQSCCIPAIHGGQMCRCREAHGKDCSCNPIAFPPSMAVRCARAARTRVEFPPPPKF